MKKKNVTILGINSKFVHTNLAIRYIKKVLDFQGIHNISIVETSINNIIPKIIREVVETKPEILIISTYIWNKEYVYKIIPELKKIDPKIRIYLGGPEVSYDSEKIMEEVREIDGIIIGEGEIIVKNLLEKDPEEIKGLYFYNKDKEIQYNGPEQPIKNLDIIPFPYEIDELNQGNGKIFYYEATRGCPFKCSYCMSSIERSVRHFSLPRVKEDLTKFINSSLTLVKFVDRTFNLKKDFYMEIWKFLVENYRKNLTLHFEISGDLFDDEVIQFLQTVPKGLFQFEIGVQTINPETVKLIKREHDLEKLKRNVLTIKDNIHLHLDLIAGLPKEDYRSFEESFNYVHHLSPEMIQLGFLKVLKGTAIAGQIEEFSYEYSGFPPYEVVSNESITYLELLKLKDIEEVLDHYYNSELFKNSLTYILDNFYQSPFKFYEEMASYYEEKGYFKVGHKKENFFQYFLDFYEKKEFPKLEVFKDLLKLDYFLMGKVRKTPSWIKRNRNEKEYYGIINDLVEKELIDGKREGLKTIDLESFKILEKDINEKEKKLLFIYKGKEVEIKEL